MKPPLSPLYRGPYRVLQLSEIFFVLQIGDKSDSVSVDRLKSVISSVPLVPAVPPLRGWPRLVPALVPRPQDSGGPLVKKERFYLVPATQLCWNPHWTVRGSSPLSVVLHLTFWGEYLVATTKTAFLILRSANWERTQWQHTKLNGTVGLKTSTISFSYYRLTFVYYHVNISLFLER